MASLFAGSIGGAIGVGVSYPFDTLSTKAQVSTGKGNEKQLNLMKSIARIWKNDGIRGFFEGVLVTVRDAMYDADRGILLMYCHIDKKKISYIRLFSFVLYFIL